MISLEMSWHVFETLTRDISKGVKSQFQKEVETLIADPDPEKSFFKDFSSF